MQGSMSNTYYAGTILMERSLLSFVYMPADSLIARRVRAVSGKEQHG
jgi:hypothetical protein